MTPNNLTIRRFRLSWTHRQLQRLPQQCHSRPMCFAADAEGNASLSAMWTRLIRHPRDRIRKPRATRRIRNAGQRRRKPLPPFWQNETPFFLRAESMPCARVSSFEESMCCIRHKAFLTSAKPHPDSPPGSAPSRSRRRGRRR